MPYLPRATNPFQLAPPIPHHPPNAPEQPAMPGSNHDPERR